MSSPVPVARLTGPAEFAALVPMLIGFVPRESVVVVSLRPPRKRIGLTMRFDLPPPALEPDLALDVAARLEEDGAVAALVVVYTDAPDDPDQRAGQRLVDCIRDACDIRFEDALLVRDGRWWSYLCREVGCCPPGGTPLAGASTPALQLLEAETALAGRAVLPSRDDLIRAVAAPVLLAARAAGQRLDAAADAWTVAMHDDPAAARAAALAAAGRLLDRAAEGAPVDADRAAALAVAVHDVHVRDEVARWLLTRADDLLALLLQVVPQVPPPYDPPICTLLAWVAYAEGNGGLANVALDRALETDPDYSMAGLLRIALDGQLPPRHVRDILRRRST